MVNNTAKNALSRLLSLREVIAHLLFQPLHRALDLLMVLVLELSESHSFGANLFELPAEIPVVGELFFQHNLSVYGSFLLIAGTYWFFYRTRRGLEMQAVGESPEAAFARGVSVRWMRYLYTGLGGALVGVGGAAFSLDQKFGWSEGHVRNFGWIALAVVIFGGGTPSSDLEATPNARFDVSNAPDPAFPNGLNLDDSGDVLRLLDPDLRVVFTFPYGDALCVPLERVTEFHQTSGTTGQPVYQPDTWQDWEWWSES